jgi:biotin transport system substrate-specific component
MEINMYVNKYKYARYAFFKWRYQLELYHKVILAVSFACVTGLLAQVRFYLPGSPIPLTGQTFAVVLSAVLLGKWWGGVSQSIYLGVGMAGVPWFAGMNGGLGYLAGPTSDISWDLFLPLSSWDTVLIPMFVHGDIGRCLP